MSTTTLITRSIPENYTGITALMSLNVAWRFSPWKVIAPQTNDDMYIVGLDFKQDFMGIADTAFEQIIEVAFGEAGNEVLKIQFPHSGRQDTSVGHYMYGELWVPEPVFVPKSTTVSARFACGQGGQYSALGIKLRVMVNRLPIQTHETVKLNNYMHASGGNGISVTEKTR